MKKAMKWFKRSPVIDVEVHSEITLYFPYEPLDIADVHSESWLGGRIWISGLNKSAPIERYELKPKGVILHATFHIEKWLDPTEYGIKRWIDDKGYTVFAAYNPDSKITQLHKGDRFHFAWTIGE